MKQLSSTEKVPYVAYQPQGVEGILPFMKQEQLLWKKLMELHGPQLSGCACQEYQNGLKKLNLRSDRPPHLSEVNQILKDASDWNVWPVSSVIGPKSFFTLLSHRKFPCATFLRRPEDFTYIKEPDIFHEIVGHCPMITNLEFANFVEKFGKLAINYEKEDHKYLFRLFWFTVEFGLIKTSDGLRIYGGGILSSVSEMKFCLGVPNFQNELQHEPYDLLTVLRSPYRIDRPQKLYYVINDFAQLFHSLNDNDLHDAISIAKKVGDLVPKFDIVDENGERLEYTN